MMKIRLTKSNALVSLVLARLIALLALLATAGCGGNEAAPDAANLQATAAEAQTGAPERSMAIDLPTALAEIDALATPADVDNAMFAELKAELTRLLGEPGSIADTGSLKHTSSGINKPEALRTRFDHHTNTLQLLYFLEGDYDQNGIVNASDIVPMAVHFGEPAPGSADAHFELGTIPYIVDANGDGEINIGDLTAIGRNYGNVFQGYDVYASEDLADIPFLYQGTYLQELGVDSRMTLQLAQAMPGLGGQLLFEQVLPGELVSYYWAAQRSSLLPVKYGMGALAGDIYEPNNSQVSWYREKATGLQYMPDENSVSLFPILRADGDLTGVVTLSDITTIGLRLGTALDPGDPEHLLLQADYNSDGKVTLLDLLGLGCSLSSSIRGYRLYYAEDEAARPAGFWDSEGNQEVLEFAYTEDLTLDFGTGYRRTNALLDFTPASGSFLYLRPFLGDELGPVCEFVQVP